MYIFQQRKYSFRHEIRAGKGSKFKSHRHPLNELCSDIKKNKITLAYTRGGNIENKI